MSKYSHNTEPTINKTYLRINPEFSLDNQGKKTNLEFGKCNYYADRKPNSLLQYIIQTWSFDSLEATLAKMLLSQEANTQPLKKTILSVHYVIDKDGSI
ncbi:hypothetical protein [Candidatus Tisiphia endosymbiont of Nemotelus uliginosus]|uniref:hypothetical protein n=1 Tax=Candidatus Tisiphia endosymbiont of Nemotelus uliginosus TaxID=3077926 RepID=UPI0035C92734